jgi:iron complex outermembrane receptor protein
MALVQPLATPCAAHADDDLSNLSIEDLMEIEVTSVSKRSQKLSQAAAAVTVLSGEEIRRSGMTSIPEALRMVPGLHVASIDASKWAITSRGFNGEFANKLLVLIDGRSVYNPLFSGVYWFEQDLMLEDVDRIEVIRGPGGTLWGANAVNGVINVITKRAEETQGLLISGAGGSEDRLLGSYRYGGAIGDTAHYRVYAKHFMRDEFDVPGAGAGEANDDWSMVRGGLRFDWNPTDRDSLTLQGEYYDGVADQTLSTGSPDEQDLSGGNVLARWCHKRSENCDFQLQLYYDRATQRGGAFIGGSRDAVDLEFQHRFSRLPRNDLIWGLRYRMTDTAIDNSSVLSFDPRRRTDHLYSAFVQNQVTVVEDLLWFTAGTKIEHNDFTGFEFQPSARLLYTPHKRHSVWAAVSRAVRVPAAADHDMAYFGEDGTGPPDFVSLDRNDDVVSEDLLAFEVGYRAQPLDRLSLDVSAYFNRYDDLRSIERITTYGPHPMFCPPGVPLPPGTPCTLTPMLFDNKLDADAYGVEVSATWNPTDFLKLIGSYTLMKVDLSVDKDSLSIGRNAYEVPQEPRHQFQIRSRLDLPWNLELDAALYYVGRVSDMGIRPAGDNLHDFTRVDVRLGWRPIEQLELSVVGQNLQDRRHTEYADSLMSVRSSVPRSVYGKVTWRH